jgi:hypothetical protein
MSSTWEHFCEAVVILAGSGSVKQRLTDAYTRHLAHVETAELPREVRVSLSLLEQAMTSSPRAGGLSAAAASVLKMSEIEAGRHAECIVRMFAGLREPASQSSVRATPLFRAVSGAD